MKLLEYQAHELFARYEIPSAKGTMVASYAELETADDIIFPVVLKSQVQTGGRGKAGGIRFAEDKKQLLAEGTALFDLVIKKLPVRKIFLTEKVDVKQELYLSITLDRKTKTPVMIFCSEGGVEINEIAEHDPDKVAKMSIEPLMGIRPHMVQYCIDKTGLAPALAPQLKKIMEGLYRLFREYDCLLAEINPLVVRSDETLMALDGKIDVDDNALIRHEDIRLIRDELTENPLVLEARKWDFLYIPVGDTGKVGVISNGSGMIMSSIDLISQKGVDVPCALDLGGGATAERVKEAILIVFSNQRVELGFINIFGGITRCDEIAKGIRLAMEARPSCRIIARMEGTNKEKGVEVIESIDGDVELVPGLVEGVERIYERMTQ